MKYQNEDFSADGVKVALYDMTNELECALLEADDDNGAAVFNLRLEENAEVRARSNGARR